MLYTYARRRGRDWLAGLAYPLGGDGCQDGYLAERTGLARGGSPIHEGGDGGQDGYLAERKGLARGARLSLEGGSGITSDECKPSLDGSLCLYTGALLKQA